MTDTTVTEADLIDIQFAKTYLDAPIDWHRVFDEPVAAFLLGTAHTLRICPEFVIGFLMLFASTLMGRLTSVLSDAGVKLQPNIYLLLVGRTRSGKSRAYSRFVAHVMREIETHYNVRLLYRQFSPAGLLAHLADNNGHGAVIDHEMRESVALLFGGYPSDNPEVRQNLNNFYYNDGFHKVFKTGLRKSVSFPQSYFTVGGSLHPDALVDAIKRMVKRQDGLEDRVAVLCADSRFVTRPCPVDLASIPRIDDDWEKALATAIYSAHRDPKQYTYSRAALETVRSLRVQADEQYNDQMEAIEEFAAGSSAHDGEMVSVPKAPRDTKDVDGIQKFAIVCHVLNHCLGSFLREGVDPSIKIPTIIERSTIVACSYLFSRIRRQYAIMRAFACDQSSIASSSARIRSRLTHLRPVLSLILMTPGNIVSSRMVARFFRTSVEKPGGIAAVAITNAMKENSRTPGEERYCGMLKTWKERNWKRQLFYKASPPAVDRHFLESIGVGFWSYCEAYNIDVSTQCPVKNILTNDEWKRTWSLWEVNRPIEMVSESNEPTSVECTDGGNDPLLCHTSTVPQVCWFACLAVCSAVLVNYMN